jgi:hypothetical protein
MQLSDCIHHNNLPHNPLNLQHYRLGFDAKFYIADQREDLETFHTSPAIGHGLKLRIEFGPDQPFSEQGLEWAKSYLERYFFRLQKSSVPVTG